MDYLEFLELDPSEDCNAQAIAAYCINMLEEIQERDFDSFYIHKLPGVLDKFKDMAISRYPKDYQHILDSLDRLMDTWIENADNAGFIRKSSNRLNFIKLHSEVVKAYNNIVKNLSLGKDFSEFQLLYNPQISDKAKASKLITEAIELINNDNMLNNRQKKQITDALIKALNTLYNDTPDWTAFFGTIQQSIIILGALGSLVGGMASVAALKQASEKVAEANKIVIETSVQEGMMSLNRSLVNLVKRKEISLEEAEAHSLNPAELRLLLERG